MSLDFLKILRVCLGDLYLKVQNLWLLTFKKFRNDGKTSPVEFVPDWEG